MVRVVGELGKVEKTCPIVLFGGDVMAKILLEHVVDPFCLTVGLWVECGGEVELRLE